MNMNKMQIQVETGGERVDRFLSEQLEGMTRSAVQKLLENGCVSCNGKLLDKNARPAAGSILEVVLPQPEELQVEAQDIPLDIRYEDDDLLVVNKPKGMVVHPAPGNPDHTLVNALLYHCRSSLSGINGVIRPGIVHRIDKDTSGLLIVAKNDFAHTHLAEQIREHSFTREYQTVVYGSFKDNAGTVDAPIGRHPQDRKKMAVLRDGHTARQAVTHYFVQERYRGFTHLRVRLETGRTHQIRVHMSYIGHPVAGDPVYGPKKVIQSLQGQCLHAGKIGFIHPRTGEYLEFSSELPAYFTDFLRTLKREDL